jgi:hypothetical protein
LGLSSECGGCLYIKGCGALLKYKWGNIGLFYFNIAIGEVGVVVLADITVTGAGKGGDVTDSICSVAGDIAEVMTVRSEYLDGIFVVVVCWLWFQCGNELTKVVVDTFVMRDSCNIELDIVYTLKALILWPYAYVVALVLDAEVLEFLDGCIRITAANYYLQLR